MRNLPVALAAAVLSIAIGSSADAAVRIDSPPTIASEDKAAQGYKALRATFGMSPNLEIGGTFAAGRFNATRNLSSAELETSRSGNVDFSHGFAPPGAPSQLYSGFIADKFAPLSSIRTFRTKGKHVQFEDRPQFGDPAVGLEALPGQASAVPEPATWVMLLLGFFAVAASMRRKSQQHAVGRERSELTTT